MQIFKKILSIILRVSISIILLIFLFKQIDKRALLETIRHADKWLLFLAFLIYFFCYFLCFYRWKMLVKITGIKFFPTRLFVSFLGGIFFSLFLPSTIGGDVVRSIDLATHTKRPREVVATVLLDRLSGYVGLVLLAIPAFLLGWKLIHDGAIFISLTIIVGILAVILLVLFNKFVYSKLNNLLRLSHADRQKTPSAAIRFRESLKGLHDEIFLFRHHKKMIAKNLLLSILVQVTIVFTFYIIALALGKKTNIIYFFIFLPIINAVSLLPISIGGLGLRDTSTVFFFAKVGIEKDISLAMSLINFFFIIIYGFIGGLIYVFAIRYRRI